MTNDEKKEYLNLKVAYQSVPFISELEKRRDYVLMTPKVLFKYRKFDEFAFDMLERSYIYMTPAGKLDDPYDCLPDANLNGIFEPDHKTLTKEMMGYLVDIVFAHSHSKEIDKEGMLKLIDDCTVEGKVKKEILETKLDGFGTLTPKQKDLFFSVMINFQNTMDTMTSDESLKRLYKLFLSAKKKIGICSFTTKRDNKPMWSLYADSYKGYCVEYEIPMKKEIIDNLCPVIYSDEIDNNIVKATVKFAIETIIRFASDGKMETDMGCFTELLCIKDKDWELQDEWRIIGPAGLKARGLIIKNIYLGFDVSLENERKVVECAERKGFGVYKMEKPRGPHKIAYLKIK